jgi:2-hydroxymuconate-semialdehyde hydrolase
MPVYQDMEFLFEGTKVQYVEGGVGKPILLLHGSAPGASTISNRRTILDSLAKDYHVFAMDLIGFGLSLSGALALKRAAADKRVTR